MIEEADRIAIVGAGAMGSGIAQVAAQSGHAVTVIDRDETALERGRASIKSNLQKLVAKGRIGNDEARDTEARISWSASIEDVQHAVLIIEAVIENFDVKKELFEKLESIVAPEAILATNTSSLSVTKLASTLKRPERFLGLHFFNPPQIMKLVEVIPAASTAGEARDASAALMKRWGKVAVIAKDVPGFIVNRVARPFYGEGWRAHEEGAADAATIDYLFRELAGFRMGPLELGDFIGHDVNSVAAQTIHAAYFGRTRFAPSIEQASLAASGRLGRKSGKGVYDYSEGAAPAAPQFAPPRAAYDGPVAFGKSSDALRVMLAPVSAGEGDAPEGFAACGDVLIGFADGRPADACARDYGRPVALLDWTGRAQEAAPFVFSASDERARNAALSLASACGRRAIEIEDRPGAVVLRTMLQLANAGADAVRDRACDEAAVDAALRYGANYPIGPMTWVREYGLSRAVKALEAIARETGDPIYAPSEYLRREARR